MSALAAPRTSSSWTTSSTASRSPCRRLLLILHGGRNMRRIPLMVAATLLAGCGGVTSPGGRPHHLGLECRGLAQHPVHRSSRGDFPEQRGDERGQRQLHDHVPESRNLHLPVCGSRGGHDRADRCSVGEVGASFLEGGILPTFPGQETRCRQPCRNQASSILPSSWKRSSIARRTGFSS